MLIETKGEQSMDIPSAEQYVRILAAEKKGAPFFRFDVGLIKKVEERPWSDFVVMLTVACDKANGARVLMGRVRGDSVWRNFFYVPMDELVYDQCARVYVLEPLDFDTS